MVTDPAPGAWRPAGTRPCPLWQEGFRFRPWDARGTILGRLRRWDDDGTIPKPSRSLGKHGPGTILGRYWDDLPRSPRPKKKHFPSFDSPRFVLTKIARKVDSIQKTRNPLVTRERTCFRVFRVFRGCSQGAQLLVLAPPG